MTNSRETTQPTNDDRLTYKDLELPNYQNNNENAMRLTAEIDGELQTVGLTLPDICFAAELAGINMIMVSDAGKGKSQLTTDIANHHFGGDVKGGSANVILVDKNTETDDIFIKTEVNLESGKYDSKVARMVDEERAQRPFIGLEEITNAPGPRQRDLMAVINNEKTVAGQHIQIGRDGYLFVLATANMNTVNGDFTTYKLDRAMLDRLHITIDMDNKAYEKTADDSMDIHERNSNPRLSRPEPRDISNKIIAMNKEIRKKATTFNPYIEATRFILSEKGMNHCEKDDEKEKSREVFPSQCSSCEYREKDEAVCYLARPVSERGIDTLGLFPVALQKIVELKHGKTVHLDPIETSLATYQLTGYHGNTNMIIESEEHQMRKGRMMKHVVDKLQPAMSLLREYMPMILKGQGTEMIEVTQDDGSISVYPRKNVDTATLAEAGLSYKMRSLADELGAMGLGTGWIDAFAKRASHHYKKK